MILVTGKVNKWVFHSCLFYAFWICDMSAFLLSSPLSSAIVFAWMGRAGWVGKNCPPIVRQIVEKKQLNNQHAIYIQYTHNTQVIHTR